MLTEDPQEAFETTHAALSAPTLEDIQLPLTSNPVLTFSNADHRIMEMYRSNSVLQDETSGEETQKLSIVEKMQRFPHLKIQQTADEERQENPSLPPSDACELVLVIFTRSASLPILPLLHTLQETLAGINTEIVLIDEDNGDSPLVIEEAFVALQTSLFRIRLEHCKSGMTSSGGLIEVLESCIDTAKAPYIAIMSTDQPQSSTQLRALYDEAIKQNVDVVLASRSLKVGGTEGTPEASHRFFSGILRRTTKLLFPWQLSRVSDPLTSFFLFKRSLLKDVTFYRLDDTLLLEILLSCPWQELVEIPCHVQQGKPDLRQSVKTLQHMAHLFKTIPAAGRVWKIGALLLFDFSTLVALFFLYPFTGALWQPFSIAVFVLVGSFNFILLNRFIFPLTEKQSQPVSSPVQVNHALTPTPDTLASTALVPQQTLQHPPVASQAIPLLQRIKRIIRQDTLFLWISFLLVLTVAAMIGYMALDRTPYTVPNAWVIFAAILFGLSITTTNTRKNTNLHHIITMLLAVSMGITFVDYLTWRVEVINWSGWWLALPLLFAEFLGALHTMGLQFTLWPRPQPRLQFREDPTHKPIFIFIPTVNEGIFILKPTIQGALTARDHYLAQYPWGQVDIILCNDGYVAGVPDWQSVESLADTMGVQCVTRKKPGGAKAGNIEHARQLVGATGDALIVIFDADQVANENFLLKTVPNMADPHIGWVQTGQYYRNLDNPVSRWADDQQSMFYNLLCPGKATWNATFICGTNVVIRARALDEIGGLPQDSVTEDFAASITLHSSWRSIYVSDILATGLGPMDLSAYLKQQRRWATGTLGVLRTHWRDLFLPKKNGLRLGQRLQYFLACTHYLCGLRDLLYLLCPILFVFTGVPAVQGSTLNAFFYHFSPYFLVSSAIIWYAGRGITGLRGIIMGFGSFPVLIESLISVILQRKVGFAVTSKKRGSQNSFGYLWIYLFFIVLCLAALAFSSRTTAKVYSALAISLLWVDYTLVMLCSFLWLYVLDWRKQRAERKTTMHSQPERYFYPSRLPLRERSFHSARNFGLSLVLAASIFLAGIIHMSGLPAPAYPLLLTSNTVPYLGVDLPVAILRQRPAQLKRLLGVDVAIVGRTQDIKDSFDTAWADDLTAHHARPWITLQFGLFQANGKPSNDASLLSITHGLQDGALTSWAQAIRAYGKPVFLTILLHVDRNWSLSSAVTNGGIPQDVAPAWLHVQSLFRQVGANNVSWLWEPADPMNDQPYAPPAASINGVVLDLISYPNTKWGDPETLVHDLIQRHPGKPIFIEVSAAGSAHQKAAWLAQVGTAAVSNHMVYALIYHDASPSLTASAALDRQWSMTSDSESLAAMSQIAARLQQHYATV